MTVRLATYNLLHGMTVLGGVPQTVRDPSGRALGAPADDSPLRRAVAELDADVLGLQEVDVHQPRSDYSHQVRVAADALRAEHWHFAPAVVGTPGEHGWKPADQRLDHVSAGTAARPDERSSASLQVERMGPLYGVGLVSRLPVLEWRSTRFDASPWSMPLLVPGDPRPRILRVPDEPRAAIAAVVQGPTGPFTVATAHLSFVPGYNIRQLRALRRWLHGLPRPLVLLGDFNLPGGVPARVTGYVELARGSTYPSFRPRVQLDHVLADGLTDAERSSAVSEVHLLPVSDHAAVTVDLDL